MFKLTFIGTSAIIPLLLPSLTSATELTAMQSVKEAHQLDDIIVEANKTKQDIQHTISNISLFYDEDINKSRINNIQRLGMMLPNFSFQPIAQSGNTLPSVRGVTANATAFSTPILLMVDGVPTYGMQGFEHSFFAVDRVEVLRGPQSTLYGRNAELGVINIYSRAIDEGPYLGASLLYGSRQRIEMGVDMSAPIIKDQLYLGVTGEFRQQHGFINNRWHNSREDDRRNYNGKINLTWKPSDDSHAILRLSRYNYDDKAAAWGSTLNKDARVVDSGTLGWNKSYSYASSLDLSKKLASGIQLRSITAQNVLFDRLQQDTDFIAPELAFIHRDYRISNLSQEFRASANGETVNWIIGLYLDNDRNKYGFAGKNPLGPFSTLSRVKGHNIALFGESNWAISPTLNLITGARIEHSKVEFIPIKSEKSINAQSKNKTWNYFLPKIGLNYTLTPKHNLFASYSQGIRAGGFNVFADSIKANYPQYQPERVHSWELGSKGQLLQNKLYYSLSAWIMQVKNMQVQGFLQPGVPYIDNAAKGKAHGFELESRYNFTTRISTQIALGYTNSKYSKLITQSVVLGRPPRLVDIDYSGNYATFAPKYSGRIGFRYESPSNIYAQADWIFRSKEYLDFANSKTRNGYGVLDLELGWHKNQFTISTYVNNLFNRRYDAAGYLAGNIQAYSPPREGGIKLDYTF